MPPLPAISIVIRAYNEASELTRMLESLLSQDYPSTLVEVVVVNNGSTDTTADVARRFGARTVKLRQNQFSYPRSLNLGVAACHNPIVVSLSAHGTVLQSNWLRKVSSAFNDQTVAGVYGPTAPAENVRWFERIVQSTALAFRLLQGSRTVRRVSVGVFGATNCAFRRSLWQQHPFDEAYGLGGEDTAWARWALSRGYKIIEEPTLAIAHSHGVGIIGYLRQLRYWLMIVDRPFPFDRSRLPRDGTWK